jgi:hypothetical protein
LQAVLEEPLIVHIEDGGVVKTFVNNTGEVAFICEKCKKRWHATTTSPASFRDWRDAGFERRSRGGADADATIFDQVRERHPELFET